MGRSVRIFCFFTFLHIKLQKLVIDCLSVRTIWPDFAKKRPMKQSYNRVRIAEHGRSGPRKQHFFWASLVILVYSNIRTCNNTKHDKIYMGMSQHFDGLQRMKKSPMKTSNTFKFHCHFVGLLSEKS